MKSTEIGLGVEGDSFRQKLGKGHSEVVTSRLRPERHNTGAEQVKLRVSRQRAHRVTGPCGGAESDAFPEQQGGQRLCREAGNRSHRLIGQRRRLRRSH